jgi:SAM-dependent methyltransferase
LTGPLGSCWPGAVSADDFALYFSHVPRQTRELDVYWRRLGGRPDFRGKRVLDFGSSIGVGAFDALDHGAREVVGIEIDERLLRFARHRLQQDYPRYRDALAFTNASLGQLDGEPFDYVLSKDVFEHVRSEGGIARVLRDMHERLRPGGLAYLGWGPLYYSPRGDHGLSRALLPFARVQLPWAHLLVPEAVLIGRYNQVFGERYASIADFGLNRLRYEEYERVVHASPLEVLRYGVNLTDNPARHAVNLLTQVLPGLKNYLVSTIYCVLRRRGA